jgi:hypothetical protein
VLELLYRYAPDEAELKKILVTNPAKLFGFDNQGVAAKYEMASALGGLADMAGIAVGPI